MLYQTSYAEFKSLLSGKSYPLAIIDLDGIDQNYNLFSYEAKKYKKKIRIASKSIRCPYIIKYLINKDPDLISGIMCYRVKEAEYLYEQKIDNLLIAYPEASKNDLECLAKLIKKGCNASIVVDSIENIKLIDKIALENNTKINIIIEIDGAIRLLNGKLNLGVRRSPIRDEKTLIRILRFIKSKKNINLSGAMLYEAQIAGLTDNGHWNSYQNPIKTKIKEVSIPKVENLRKRFTEIIKSFDFNIEIINGGGSGSIFSTTTDETVTEITVGSGFLCSHLFSHYEGIYMIPSIFFATQIVRKPEPNYVTALGGGFIASGAIGKDREPEVFLPKGLKQTDLEGFGEVQTPFKIMDKRFNLNIGDPIILRHSKAGELAEHFNEYNIFRGNKIIEQVKTYRGFGKCFL